MTKISSSSLAFDLKIDLFFPYQEVASLTIFNRENSRESLPDIYCLEAPQMHRDNEAHKVLWGLSNFWFGGVDDKKSSVNISLERTVLYDLRCFSFLNSERLLHLSYTSSDTRYPFGLGHQQNSILQGAWNGCGSLQTQRMIQIRHGPNLGIFVSLYMPPGLAFTYHVGMWQGS